jgi:hypothetical protein
MIVDASIALRSMRLEGTVTLTDNPCEGEGCRRAVWTKRTP